ncbi:MAG TPA: hypothetical protein VF070_00300 [Streptosporangiaceae bacterium]
MPSPVRLGDLIRTRVREEVARYNANPVPRLKLLEFGHRPTHGSANTTLVEDLASCGYLVATIDHTYSDDEVEFPAAGSRSGYLTTPADEFPQDGKAAAARSSGVRVGDIHRVTVIRRHKTQDGSGTFIRRQGGVCRAGPDPGASEACGEAEARAGGRCAAVQQMR